MNRALFCSALTVAVAFSARAWADEDHSGQDVTIDADTTWDGSHTNIKTLTVSAGATLKVTAGQPLAIFAQHIMIAGAVDANGAGYAAVSGASDTGKDGSGPGAGKKGGATMFGGGGAAYGGKGGCGRNAAGCAGAGGTPYGSALDGLLELGSSGGSAGGIAAQSPGPPSGAGGGALTLSADQIDISGSVSADGANGGSVTYSGTKSGSGGGSGGGIALIAGQLNVTGTLSAKGGAGGDAPCTPLNLPCSPGGGGGGGWVKILYWGSDPGLTPDVSGGPGGAHQIFAGVGGDVGSVLTEALATVQPDASAVSGSGAIAIPFKILDLDSDPCTLEVMMVQNGSATPVTLQGGSGDAGPSLSSSPAGAPGSVTWDAAKDLPGVTGSIELRLRAHDGFAFGPAASVTVTLGGSSSGDGGTTPTPDGGTTPPGDGGTLPAGPGGGSSDSGGCSCSFENHDARTGSAWAALLLLAGLSLGRRKRA